MWLRTTSTGWRSQRKSWTRPTSTEHPPCNVRQVSASHGTAIAAVASHAAGPAASCFANFVPNMLPLPYCTLPATPLPASLLPPMPGPRPSAALCTGCSEIPVLARPARPPSPALYVCVCDGRCDVPVPVDVSLAFVLAVVCYAVAPALFRPLFCLRSRFRFRMLMWVVARPAAFVCNVLCSVLLFRSLCVCWEM